MYEHDYWNDKTKKRMTIKTEKTWDEMQFEPDKMLLIKTVNLDTGEPFNPNLPPPKPKVKKKVEKPIEAPKELLAEVSATEMKWLKVCKICGQPVDGNLKEHVDSHQPIHPLFYFTVVPELKWED